MWSRRARATRKSKPQRWQFTPPNRSLRRRQRRFPRRLEQTPAGCPATTTGMVMTGNGMAAIGLISRGRKPYGSRATGVIAGGAGHGFLATGSERGQSLLVDRRWQGGFALDRAEFWDRAFGAKVEGMRSPLTRARRANSWFSPRLSHLSL